MEQFAAKYETIWMRISTSGSEAMFLCRKWITEMDLKYLKVLLMREGKMEREVNSQTLPTKTRFGL